MADNTSYSDMMLEFLGKGIDRKPTTLLPAIRTDLRKLSGDLPVLVWFGHSSYLLHINGKNILIDPVFSRRASPFQFIGIKSYEVTNPYTVDNMPDIDLLIITHDHYDHLDYTTMKSLKTKVKKVCTTLGVGTHLRFWGFSENIISEFDWWDSETVIPGIQLTSVPARHFSGRTLTRNKTLWSAFVLKTTQHSLYLGGDSGYDENMFRDIGNKCGPFDLALLECGQYNTMWPSIHMMPEETVKASVLLKAKALLPVHWGKFTLSLHPWYEPIERVVDYAAKAGVEIVTPMIGERVIVGESYPNAAWWELQV